VSVRSLVVSPLNVRKRVGDITDLQKSIQSIGLLQPIVVREVKGKYEVVLGQRRFLACKALNWEKIPAVKRPMTDREALILSLTENVQIDTLDPIDRAEGTKRLVDEFAKDMPRQRALTQVAKLVGKAEETLYDWLRLLETTEAVKMMIRERRIDTETGARLASLPKGAQREVAEVLEEESVPQQRAAKVIAQVGKALEKEPGLRPKEAVKEAITETEEYSINVSFSGAVYGALVKIAKKQKVTVAETIRKAVRKYLSEAEKS